MTIQKIFGHEAGDHEDVERLRQYYFKSKTYDRVTADLSLRILVGHKGIGKSALFRVAIAEDTEAQSLPILVRPDDVPAIGSAGFLSSIQNWKYGLQAIIAKKTLEALGINKEGPTGDALNVAGKILGYIQETVRPLSETRIDLTSTQKGLITKFLKRANVTVYLDDVDRGWKGRPEDVSALSALVNAIRDLSRDNPGLRFKIALRTDVYFLLRTYDESGDKLDGSVIWLSWSNHEILAMLVKRIETYFGRTISEQRLHSISQPELGKFLNPIVTPAFMGEGRWRNVPTYKVLMSLIRKRPRDLVKLCSLAAQHAAERNRDMIITDDLRSIFETYSSGRIDDTVIEYQSELPDIRRLLLNMKPNRKEKQAAIGYVYKTDALLAKITQIMGQGAFDLANKKKATASDLAQFLYKINFLTARTTAPSGVIIRKYFEESKYLAGQEASFGFDWEIHPAYRWALQPDDPDAIYQTVDLTAE